jgi:tetratricopeptide (TPR) repeat protein
MRRYYVTALICFLLFTVLDLIGQDSPAERYLEVRGISELDMKPLPKATANLYEGKNLVRSVQTGFDGRFTFKLEINKQYVIEVAKDGLVSKCISFNTAMPDEEKGSWTNEFSMGLVKYCDGVDYSILKQPVDNVRFDPKRREFVSDKDYVSAMRPKIENVLSKYEQCMLEKYEAAVKKGDQLMAQKNPEAARNAYQEALEVFPDETYPSKRIAEIDVQLARSKNSEELYNKTIAEAEALLVQQNYTEALQKFSSASSLKPYEAYPKQKVTEINTVLARQKAEQQSHQALEDKYNQAMARASVAYTRKDYSAAKQYYQEALDIKPEESTPRTRMQEIDAILSKKATEEARIREVNDAYKAALAKADQLLQNKDYQGAKDQYAKASDIKPAEAYPKAKMTEIDQAVQAEARTAELAKKTALEKEYQNLVTQADELFKAKSYEASKAKYNEALALKPTDSYASQRIKAIDNQVAAEQAAEQKAKQDGYSAALSLAESALSRKQYDDARTAIQKALSYKPEDAYARSKLAEIDKLAEAYKQQQIAEQQAARQYNDLISNADALFQDSKLPEAREIYNQALAVKPGDQYAMIKVTTIGKMIAAEEAVRVKAAEDGYKAAIGAANTAIMQKSYSQAKESLQQALVFKPGDPYATMRITEVNNMIDAWQKKQAEEQEMNRLYKETIVTADKLYGAGDLAAAKTNYLNALQYKPGDPYASQQITAIENLAAAQLAEKQKQVEDAYSAAMNLGTSSLLQKDYAQARNAFQNALNIKPGDVSAQSKLRETELLIRNEAERIAEEQARKNKYDALLKSGDQLMAQKDFENAKACFEQALELMPGESYPREKLEEINSALSELQRIQAEKQASDNAYAMAMTGADKYFRAKDYYGARDEYSRASMLKPEESLPRTRLAEVENLIRLQQQTQAEAKMKSEAYAAAMNKANDFFNNKEYQLARDNYAEALRQMPDDKLAKEQLSKTEYLLAEAEKQKQAELARQKAYSGFIAQADKAYDDGQYALAKVNYKKALEIEPTSVYAKERIEHIDNINRALSQRSGSSGLQHTANQQKVSASSPLGELNFKTESERQSYLDDLRKKYPDGITLEKYKEKYKEIYRYIVIRDDQAQEFRQIRFLNYNGVQYSVNGKPITQQYFLSQVKVRDGENYKEIDMQ